jgi:hypothetical protein
MSNYRRYRGYDTELKTAQILKLVRSWKDVPTDFIIEALEVASIELIGREAWEDRIVDFADRLRPAKIVRPRRRREPVSEAPL